MFPVSNDSVSCWSPYLTKEIDIVASAKGSPMMLVMLALLRLGAFMLKGFFKDGEYSEL